MRSSGPGPPLAVLAVRHVGHRRLLESMADMPQIRSAIPDVFASSQDRTRPPPGATAAGGASKCAARTLIYRAGSVAAPTPRLTVAAPAPRANLDPDFDRDRREADAEAAADRALAAQELAEDLAETLAEDFGDEPAGGEAPARGRWRAAPALIREPRPPRPGRPRRLPHDRRGGRRALCRQGQEHQEARRCPIPAPPATPTASPAWCR